MSDPSLGKASPAFEEVIMVDELSVADREFAVLEAGREFKQEWSASDVVTWYRKWCKLAGHRRLRQFLASNRKTCMGE